MAKQTTLIAGASRASITCKAEDIPNFVASMYECGFLLLKASMTGHYLDISARDATKPDTPVTLDFFALPETD